MLTNIFSRFRLDYDGNYSVKKINIYLLRLLYLLIFLESPYGDILTVIMAPLIGWRGSSGVFGHLLLF